MTTDNGGTSPTGDGGAVRAAHRIPPSRQWRTFEQIGPETAPDGFFDDLPGRSVVFAVETSNALNGDVAGWIILIDDLDGVTIRVSVGTRPSSGRCGCSCR